MNAWMSSRLLLLSTLVAIGHCTSGWSFNYNVNASAQWQAAISSAAALTSQMTLEELNNVTYGITTACSGLTGGVQRLGFDGLCYNDLGKADLTTSFPEGVSVGASWNSKLAYQRGLYLGAESRRKGAKVVLTPVIEPIGRTALNGRNMEGFGADPFLAGKLSAASVLGIQQTVISSVKHYIAYEQETYRNPTPNNPVSVSSNVNDKDMHELYLWAYQDAIAAGAGCIMCSYNRINGVYACENNDTLNGLLKGELNFPGFVVSDWGAQRSGLASAVGGLDVAMPSSTGLWDQGALAAAVQNGSLSRDRLQDMATRQIAASFYVFGNQSSQPPNGYGYVTNYLAPHQLVDARDPASKPMVLQSAIEGHVLVKNINNALPLQKPKILSLFGYDGTVQQVNNPALGLLNLEWLYALQDVNISQSAALQLLQGLPTVLPQIAGNGVYVTATGSGSNVPGYISDPYSAISQRAYEDDIYLWWDFQSFTPNVSAASTACLVFINDFSTEAAERAGLADPASDQLVLHVASQCANTIVVVHNPFIRILDAFYDHPNVTAIMLAHLPGQDSGRALVKLLFGDESPSGKLPYTIARNASDYGPLLNASDTSAEDPQSNFSDPSMFDYRYFQAYNITPRVPFGTGLSYTTFSYSNVQMTSDNFTTASSAPPNPDDRIPGGIRSLFHPLATVSLDVTNNGGNYTSSNSTCSGDTRTNCTAAGFNKPAAEVIQVYVRFPGETVRVLRGFTKQVIAPGQTMNNISIDLTRRDLSRWDVDSQQWLLPSGSTEILVGASSTDLRARLVLTR